MHLSNERMIVILLVGVAAGFLASRVARGSGAGLVGDAAIGVVGALIANWLLPRFHIHLVGSLGGIVDSAIGATLLLLILRLVGASEWGGGQHSSAYRR